VHFRRDQSYFNLRDQLLMAKIVNIYPPASARAGDAAGARLDASKPGHSVTPGAIRGLGDLVEWIAKPIAKRLKLKCLDEKAQLKPESPCAKRKAKLNKAFPI